MPPPVTSIGANQTRLSLSDSVKLPGDMQGGEIRSTRQSRFGFVRFKPSLPSSVKNHWLYRKILSCLPIKYSVRFERDLETLRNSVARVKVESLVQHHVRGNEELINEALHRVACESPGEKLNLEDPNLVPNVLAKIKEIEFERLQRSGVLNEGYLKNSNVDNLDVKSEAFERLSEDAQRQIRRIEKDTLNYLLKKDGADITRAAGNLPKYTSFFGGQTKFREHYRNVAKTVFREVLIETYTSTDFFKKQAQSERPPVADQQVDASEELLISSVSSGELPISGESGEQEPREPSVKVRLPFARNFIEIS